MTLPEVLALLDFFIDKSGTAFYTRGELCALLDKSQMDLFADYRSKASASQRIKEALAPFRSKYDFTTADTAAGLVTVPADRNFEALLDVQVGDEPVKLVNEDERALRLKSQIDPVTATYRIGEIAGVGVVQLYPKSTAAGTLTFYRRPKVPVYLEEGVGRAATYKANGSQNLEWADTQKLEIITKTLTSLGINLGDGEIAQYAEGKSAQHFQNVNH
jgi:hypothetical protein